MTRFTSVQEFKDRAQFFPKGRIVPQRILKAPRRVKDKVVFGSNTWALPYSHGYILVCEYIEGGFFVRVGNVNWSRSAKIRIVGAPYSQQPARAFWLWEDSVGCADTINETIAGSN